MMLRKRPRPPMRRTASMTKFADEAEAPRPAGPMGADSQSRLHAHLQKQQRNQRREVGASDVAAEVPWRVRSGVPGVEWLEAGCHPAGVSALGERGGGGRRRNSGDLKVVETAPFLMACGLCKRRLGPGRDTFMYRGDTAFCSLECRQQHINQVELKEKCSLTSMKDTAQATNASEKPDKNGETAAAA